MLGGSRGALEQDKVKQFPDKQFRVTFSDPKQEKPVSVYVSDERDFDDERIIRKCRDYSSFNSFLRTLEKTTFEDLAVRAPCSTPHVSTNVTASLAPHATRCRRD